MQSQVPFLANDLQIREIIVQFVAVSVVYGHPGWNGAMSCFPHDVSAKSPDIRLGELDESPPLASALMPSPNANSANRESILDRASASKLTIPLSHEESIGDNYAGGKRRTQLLAPFPYFGGKRQVSDEIWARFGNVENFVEPFAGSLAVLLNRPHKPKTETINDKDRFLANFWRSVQAEPEAVAHHADWPVNEADLEARHYWLVTEGAARLAALSGDPLAYDTQIAGWWVWGACAWIGSGWCSGQGPWRWLGEEWDNGAAGRGINRQLPHFGDAGQGINRQLPHLSAGQGINRKLLAWFSLLQERLRNVRVACGDWSRVCGPSVTWRHGLTAVFLDPPYSAEADRAEVYSQESMEVGRDAAAWAIEHGKRLDMRIALCGYEGEHQMPDTWDIWRWKAKGGYGSQGEGRGRINCLRECIWFSPHCIPAQQMSLLAGVA